MRTHGERTGRRKRSAKFASPSPEAVVTILVAANGLTSPSAGPKNT